MKKTYIILALLLLLSGCSKDKVKPEESNEVEEPVPVEEEGAFILPEGQEIIYSDIEVRTPDEEGNFVTLDTTSHSKKEILHSLESVNATNSTDIYKSDYDGNSIILGLSDLSYIELIESSPNSQGLYLYNYYYDKELKEILASERDLKKEIYEEVIDGILLEKGINPNPHGELTVNIVDLVKKFHEDGKLIVLANVYNEIYNFKDGIFDQEGGYASPVELRFKNAGDKYTFEEIIYPEDGSLFGESLEKMSRGDKEVLEKLLQSQISYRTFYNKFMENLYRLAEEKGLENFSHKLEEIPGYKDNVVYIEDGPNHLENTIEIANKEDYEAAKNRVGTENWTYVEGITYDKNTGIVIKSKIDYFE